MPQSSTLGMNATLKNESPLGDTYTEKNPRFVPEGRWRMPRPSGTGSFTGKYQLAWPTLPLAVI